MNKIISGDIKFIIKKIKSVKNHLKKSKILIIGGTGFIGKWFLLVLNELNKKENYKISVFLLTRNEKKFRKKFPEFAKFDSISFIEGDLLNLKIPYKNFDYIIHAGSDLKVKNKNEENYFNELTIGTKKIFDLPNKNKNAKILFISSGAVYGPVTNTKPIKESDIMSSKFSTNDIYSLGKTFAEIYAQLYTQLLGKKVIIARGFSFIGPFQQFDRGFAITDFIKMSVKNKNIFINNAENIYRSYLYIADLIVWLFIILINGKNGQAYNVGSNKEISLKNLSKKIVKITKSRSKIILKNNNSLNKKNFYVPNTDLARKKLNLKVWTNLDQSIDKTVCWFKSYHL